MQGDVDENGRLDKEELVEVLKAFYELEGVLRSLAVVNAEVHTAMRLYDTDESGELDFGEFIDMVCDVSFEKSKRFFRFRVADEVLCQVQRLRSSDYYHIWKYVLIRFGALPGSKAEPLATGDTAGRGAARASNPGSVADSIGSLWQHGSDTG